MEVWLLWIVAVFAAVTEVEVFTSDGEILRGTVKLSTIEMDTAFGSATIDIDKVVEITFGEEDVVVTTADVDLRGKVKLKRLRLEGEGKPRTLSRRDLARLLVAANAGSGGWTGEWMSSNGPMKLEQVGTKVTGTYGWSGDAKIEGKVDGNKLTFEWKRGSYRGPGEFELFDDASAFTGESRAKGADSGDGWAGYRREAKTAAIQPGEVTEGQSASGLNYHMRAPKGWDGKSELPAIAFFHGSNMSARAYVDTIAGAWPKLADDYLVIGFDGEQLSSRATEDNRFYNYSYINFSGHEVGEPWRYKQSPGLVAEALEELKGQFPIRHWIVGGHSQGGFLTYAVVMFYPDLVGGALPMSCNLLVQCEPDYGHFEDHPELIEAQHATPIVHVHGTTDPQVGFSSATYCYERLQDGHFPMIRLLADEHAGHMFAHLPVDEAVRWLESMLADDPTKLVDFATTRAKDEAWADVTAALDRAERLGLSSADTGRAKALRSKVAAALAPTAKKLKQAISVNANGRWVDDFWEFRRQFGHAKEAEPIMAAYGQVREEHEDAADRVFGEARGERDQERKRQKWLKIRDEYWGSKWYPLVKRWLKE